MKNAEYFDVSNQYWAYEAICKLNLCGIVTGYPDNNFLPEKGINRAEMAKIVEKFYEIDV